MNIDVRGLDEFERLLLEVAKEKYPNEAKKEIRKLAKDSIKISKTLTPKGKTGNLRKGWKIGKLYRRQNNFWIVVKNVAPHAHLLESGHKIVVGGKLGRSGRVVGFVPGKFFLERSMRISEDKMPDEIKRWLESLVERLKL